MHFHPPVMDHIVVRLRGQTRLTSITYLKFPASFGFWRCLHSNICNNSSQNRGGHPIGAPANVISIIAGLIFWRPISTPSPTLASLDPDGIRTLKVPFKFLEKSTSRARWAFLHRVSGACHMPVLLPRHDRLSSSLPSHGGLSLCGTISSTHESNVGIRISW